MAGSLFMGDVNIISTANKNRITLTRKGFELLYFLAVNTGYKFIA